MSETTDTPLTAEQIAELRALGAKATPGPWWGAPGIESECVMADAIGWLGEFVSPADADLTVAMRNALPGLLAGVSRLTEERDSWRRTAERIARERDDAYAAQSELADNANECERLSSEAASLRAALTRAKDALAERPMSGRIRAWQIINDALGAGVVSTPRREP